MNNFLRSLIIFSFVLITLNSVAQEPIFRNLPSFQGISVIGKMRVELYKSDIHRAEILVSNATGENVITKVENGTLHISLTTNTGKNAVIKIKVFYSDLTDLLVAANSILVSPDTLSGDKISFTARSMSKMELNLDVKTIQADVIQGAILVFSGKTNRQDIKVNTGATYSAYKLKSEDSYVKASSGSKAKVCASRIIDASSNTKSYIGYIGTPVSVYSKTDLGGEIASFANEDAVFDEE